MKKIRRVCSHCKKADNYHSSKEKCGFCGRRFEQEALQDKYKVY